MHWWAELSVARVPADRIATGPIVLDMWSASAEAFTSSGANWWKPLARVSCFWWPADSNAMVESRAHSWRLERSRMCGTSGSQT